MLGVTGEVETPVIGTTPGVTLMTTIDCPFCSGDTFVEPALETITCDGCGVTVEVAPDPVAVLDAAA